LQLNIRSLNASDLEPPVRRWP